MKKLRFLTFLWLAMNGLLIGQDTGEKPNGTPNPHGLQLQYCYGSIKKAYNLSAGPHYLNVVRNMEHLVFWNHSLGGWASNYVDVRIFEETSPGFWTLVHTALNVDYLPMSGYTLPVKFTFNSYNLFKVEFYLPASTIPLDINCSTQVYIKPCDMDIVVDQPYNTCPLPNYSANHAIQYSIWPLTEHAISCYKVTNPLHYGYENVVDGVWDFGKGVPSQLMSIACWTNVSIVKPFTNYASFSNFYDGINDPCQEGSIYGECYDWNKTSPWDNCRKFEIEARLWAYDILNNNTALDEHNPCNPGPAIDSPYESPDILCGTCLKKEIQICKTCKPPIFPSDDPSIIIVVSPNPAHPSDEPVIIINNQNDLNYITDIEILHAATGSVMGTIKGIPYQGPQSQHRMDISRYPPGAYQIVAHSSSGYTYHEGFLIE